tara:strand:+ start:5916 stop:6926 length:1011 start_codon:yes stop_codon:yes gene_type:complete
MKILYIAAGLILAVNSLKGNPMGHEHSKNVEWEGDDQPSLYLSVQPYDSYGWVVIYNANNFTFNAENASSQHIQGEGHGHLYVNDVKIARLYGEPYYLRDLNMGANTIRITLNTNNHLSYVFNGAAIEKNVEIVVEKNVENISKINLTEKEWSKAILPKVKIEVVEDKMKGWNLHIKAKNYALNEFDSESKSRGCFLLSINNENITKIFGNNYHIGMLPKEHNIVKVLLMADNSSIYTYKDAAIMDFQLVMDHGQHNHGDHDHGSGNHLYVKHNTTIPFEISFKSEKDSTYVIEASHDLMKWSEIGEVQGTGTSVKFIERRKALFPKQYYRVKKAE